jgi:hypothetical protein
LQVIVPAPMLTSSAMSASPMYERWLTFEPKPMREALTSVKLPMRARGPMLD